jgi:iron transport multicopper oxidase
VNQCPIIPSNSFQYNFKVPDQAVFYERTVVSGMCELTLCLSQGTYWYHSHYKNQYCDGLRGALVVRDPNDPQASLYDIDDGVS